MAFPAATGCVRAAALCGAVLGAAPLAAAQDEPPHVEVSYRLAPIEPDGVLSEWPGRPSIVLDRAEQVWSQKRDPAMQWEGPADLSAEFWLAYDAAHLYLGGRVHDDSLVPGRVGGEWYHGDAIELFFDLGDPAAGPLRGEFDEDVFQLFLMPFSEERPWGVMDWRQLPAAPSGANLTGVRAVFHRDPDAPGVYTFEAVVPFHNFPRIRGRSWIGFSVAIDDHDEGRAGRYQYVSWNGEQLVDQREHLGVLTFAGIAPLEAPPGGDFGAYGWVSENARYLLVPLLVVVVVGLLLWGFAALSRRFPVARLVGRALGVSMFVIGLLLPGWFEERRLQTDRTRLQSVVETLQSEVPRMEGSLLGGYRGQDRDRVLVDLLAGRPIVREQKFRYTLHAALAGEGPVMGVGVRSLPGLGFDVRPYGIPLELDELELFGFREPLRPGRLNVVVARPLNVAGSFPEAFDAVDPTVDDVVVLEIVTYGPDGHSTGSVLEVPGPFMPSNDPALERMEVSYKTITFDAPLESLAIACRQGSGVRLAGLTWVSPLGEEAVQEPLFLGVDTIGGVPTDLRGPWPRTAGVELRENGGTATFELPEDAANGFRKLWLVFHGVYRTRPVDLLGAGSHVCELTIEFAEEGVEPMVVPFEHQQTMFFGQDRANRELPQGGAVQVAQRWEGEDGEARADFVREIDLPPDATPTVLRLRNTGPYAIRFRSAVFGTEVPTVATSTADSPLVRSDDGEVLRPEILERLAGVDVAVYRNGRLSASTLGPTESQERVALPDEARRVAPDDRALSRTVSVGDGVVHESYTVLRGEAWSGTVLAVLRADPQHGEFLRSVHRVGAVLWLGALPVLLLMFSEILAVLNNLRLRLVSVLTVATLVPLFGLSVVLFGVLEGDHEARTRERVQQAVGSAEKQLGEESQQLLVNARSWLKDLVAAVEERELLQRPDLAAAMEEVLAPMMQSQMPPSWEQSGYLQFEFNPPPDSEGRAPVAVQVSGGSMKNLDTQLRTEVGVYLVWSVPLVGVRSTMDLPGGAGSCALSVARQLDGAFLSSLRRDHAILLCDTRGYPVEAAGSTEIAAADLVRNAQRPDVQAEREELLRGLVPGKQPAVLRQVTDAGAWIAGYLPVMDLQGTPRLLLGLFDEDTVATLPLQIGRIPVRAFFAGAAGLLLVLSLFLSFVVSSRISRPIERLERGAQQLGRGHLDVQIETEEAGQIGRLTRSFNQMATDLRARIQDLRLLNRGIQELTSKLELPGVVGSATSFYVRHSPADEVRLLLGRGDAERVEVTGTARALVPREDPVAKAALQATGPFSMRVDGAPEGVAVDAAFAGRRSLVGFPLVLGGRSRGAVLLLFAGSRPPEVDLDLLWTMAAQTAAAVENARLYQIAVEDVRTGALRREYFATRVAEEVARAEHEGRPLSLLGVRIEGGRALAAELGAERVTPVVERLVSTVRETLCRECLVCRSDELELQVLLRAGRADAEAARDALASAIRERADELVPGREIQPVEVGVAVFPEEAASAEFLFAALDARMERHYEPGPSPAARELGAGFPMSSPAMAGVLRTIERIAPTDISVLLIGETGTGKEVLADVIHRWSKRSGGPLVKVHCAALPETLLASELFGHEKGAFTGAVERKLGRFEQAQGGTIFLDEIGEISHEVQVKLLRVLQEREIDRVGGTQPVPVDVRVVAATNRDIERMVAEGEFREDLYYRLQGMLIRVPPLRERKEDLPAMLETFRREAVASGQTAVEGFTAEAMDELFRRDWPGNIRELRNTAFRAMVLATGPRATRADVLGISRPDAVPTAEASRGESSEERAPKPPPPVSRAPSGPPDPDPSLLEATRTAPPHLAERLRRVWEWVAARGEVSSQEYAEREGVSSRTALRDLSRLTDEGILVRIGKRRGARYRLANSTGAAADGPETR